MLGMVLTDGLGRDWDLMAGGQPLVTLAGVKGLRRPSMVKVKGSSTPALHGTRWAGWRADSRTVVLPVAWDAPDGQVVATVRSMMAGLVPDQPGRPGTGPAMLSVTLPDSTRWQVGMHLVDDGDGGIDLDPELAGTDEMVLVFDADVFWTGPSWSSSWQASSPVSPWLMTSGGVFALSSSHTLSSATATNAGDVRVWPVWTITGPCTAASVGIGTHQVTLSATLTAGQSVTIDCDPEVGQMAIRNDGLDVTSSLTAVDFAPLEPGQDTPLAISLTGTGSVSMSFRPKRLAIL